MKSFPGLAHRMQQVARADGIAFINDSKATNADAAEKALSSFENIYWIAGGIAKSGGIEPLRPLFPRVARSYLIGQAAEQFAATLGSAMPVEKCGTLEKAVARRCAMHGREAAGGGRAALARLRQLRPVSQFRGAGRCLRQGRLAASRHRDDLPGDAHAART
jgi:UDP-N-acetylmuramoylalanine--D-glutamate ligase